MPHKRKIAFHKHNINGISHGQQEPGSNQH
jgi:hypothetical protein